MHINIQGLEKKRQYFKGNKGIFNEDYFFVMIIIGKRAAFYMQAS